MDREYSMPMDGKWVTAASGQTFRCTDPYTGESWGRLPRGGSEDVARAVGAARRAFDEGGWAERGPAARGAVLRRLAELIDAHAEELAVIQVHENGKLISEMLPGARALARQCAFTAGLGETLHGYTVATDIPNTTTYSVREPMGVVAAITPWNSPLGLLGFKLFPALAAGCTVVIKPSEVTPASTLRLAELCEEAGVPEGVVNVVTGFGHEAGEALVAHPGVDKVAFTGSTATGMRIAQTAAGRLARVSLELGGKSPNIVFSDADLDESVHGVMAGVFAASGQTCIAGSRVLVQRAVYDDFVAALVARTERLRLGDPLDASTQVGPLATRGQLDKVLGYVELGVSEGARLVVGGKRPDEPAEVAQGYFVEPSVFAEVGNGSRLAQEEIFGPVACVLPFEDEDDAVRLANATRFGLAGGVWSRDVGRAQRMAKRIRAGSIWVNTYRVGHHAMPFGGYKQSGLGRELGLDALHEYTEVKSVWLDHGNRQAFGR
jgi:acyl-CoA reductase-like NAD-dependent aldehyde dehydrogenase